MDCRCHAEAIIKLTVNGQYAWILPIDDSDLFRDAEVPPAIEDFSHASRPCEIARGPNVPQVTLGKGFRT